MNSTAKALKISSRHSPIFYQEKKANAFFEPREHGIQPARFESAYLPHRWNKYAF
jgi:hypothetical protein